MKGVDFRQMMHDELQELIILNKEKGEEYSGEDDALTFLKQSARETGLPPFQIWFVLARKHWSSIVSFVRNGEVKSNESIHGRIRDLHVYLFLFQALIKEKEEDYEHAPAAMGDPAEVEEQPTIEIPLPHTGMGMTLRTSEDGNAKVDEAQFISLTRKELQALGRPSVCSVPHPLFDISEPDCEICILKPDHDGDHDYLKRSEVVPSDSPS